MAGVHTFRASMAMCMSAGSSFGSDRCCVACSPCSAMSPYIMQVMAACDRVLLGTGHLLTKRTQMYQESLKARKCIRSEPQEGKIQAPPSS